MTGPENAGSREQEVSTISRMLKSISKELNVPIIALSQLNRSVEIRGGFKRPVLSDLRESGAIEQDADMVVFIHRPEKFGIEQFDDQTSTRGIAEIILAKNRNGPVDDVRLRFVDTKAQFVELIEYDEPDGYDAGSRFQSKMNYDRIEGTGRGNDSGSGFDGPSPF